MPVDSEGNEIPVGTPEEEAALITITQQGIDEAEESDEEE